MVALRWFLLLLLLALAGCASDDHDDRLNDLWRQGYGSNNPNYDRARNGLPPVDFNKK